MLYHLTLFSLTQLHTGRVLDFWYSVNDVLLPVRMPLFFVISGVFAARALPRPWAAVLRPRIANTYWVYVVWLVLQALVLVLLPANVSSRAWAQVPLDLVVGTSWMWYLYALVVYFAVAKVLRGWWPSVLVVTAAVSFVAYAGGIDLGANGTSLVRNGVFFAFGAYLPGVVAAVRNRASVTTLVLVAPAFVVAAAVAAKLDLDAVPGVGPVLAVLGIMAGVVGASVVTRVGRVADLGAWLGSRTMPVYVLHVPLLFSLTALLPPLPPAVALVYPPVAAVLVVGASLLLHAGLVRAAPWLFALPAGWFTERSPARHAAGSAPVRQRTTSTRAA